jgi:hypothetical protein
MLGLATTGVVTCNFECLGHRDTDVVRTRSVGQWMLKNAPKGRAALQPITLFVFPEFGVALPLVDFDLLMWNAQGFHHATVPLEQVDEVYANALYIKPILQSKAICEVAQALGRYLHGLPSSVDEL